MQQMIRLSKPAEVDLDAFHHEVNTNFTSLVNLALKFSGVLLDKQCPTALIVTGSHLSLVPSVAMPAYSASKAALHAFMDCLRHQNKGKNCKFIEITAPAVQSRPILLPSLFCFACFSTLMQPQRSSTTTWARSAAALSACRSETLLSKSTRSWRDPRSTRPSAFRMAYP